MFQAIDVRDHTEWVADQGRKGWGGDLQVGQRAAWQKGPDGGFPEPGSRGEEAQSGPLAGPASLLFLL